MTPHKGKFALGTLALAISFAAVSQTEPGVSSAIDEYPHVFHWRSAVNHYKDGFDANALASFRRSSLWGNKEAQFNVGLMYFSGIGTEVDRARGLAWVQLACERIGCGYKKTEAEMLQLLSDVEKNTVSEIFDVLLAEYGDFAALERRGKWVRKKRRKLTGSRTGSLASAIRISGGRGRVINGSQYLEYLETFETELADIVTTVEYRDFKVIEDEREQE